MKIAHILPASVIFPLKSHNGRYEWVLSLASLQAKSGHDVTIYCNQGSYIDGVRTIGIQHITDDKKYNNQETFRLALEGDHDIYHSHFDNLHYEISDETTKQIVYTQHWWPDENTIRQAQATSSKNVWAVPPTNYMYEFDTDSGIQSKGFIYHGIDLDLFRSSNTKRSGRLLFVGRISQQKNLDIALLTTQRTGVGLDIIGKVTQKDQGYWEKLQPLIARDQVRYLGPKSHKELVHYYSSALAVIFPSDISETFGLVAIEAQACGTPIIMKKGGSRGELLEEGVTGFLCETDDDFDAAVSGVSNLKSTDCIGFAKKFDVRVMARHYEDLYNNLITSQIS